jgi:DnaJ-class molecular chaperone
LHILIFKLIKVSLEHMYNGYMKKLAVTRTVIDKAKGVEQCSVCRGQGYIVIEKRMGNMFQRMQSPCTNPQCQGGKQFSELKIIRLSTMSRRQAV